MRYAIRSSLQFGLGVVVVTVLLASIGWTQHYGGGGHGGFGGHSSFGGGHGYAGHSGYGGLGYGHSGYGGYGLGHSGYGGLGYGHSGYGGLGHSGYGGRGYAGHSGYGGHGYGHSGYGEHGDGGHGDVIGGLGLYFAYGSYPYYTSYGSSYSVPYYEYAAPSPVVSSRPVVDDILSSIDKDQVASPSLEAGSIESMSHSNRPSGDQFRQSAENAFRAGQFGNAARLANHALVEDSDNVNLHLLFSQALFAAGDYRDAALAVHRAAAVGGIEKLGYHVKNGKNLYRNSSYTDALNRLNSFIGKNPNDAAARFLRGYHFMFLENHSDRAARELARVVKLQPQDRLAADLLSTLTDGGNDVAQPTLGTVSEEVQSEPAKSDHKHADHKHP